jgi:hypothetical protein
MKGDDEEEDDDDDDDKVETAVNTEKSALTGG